MKKTLLSAAAVVMSGCYWDGCIARGSAVLTPRGRRPIDSLVPGDEVICIDPETRERVVGLVSATRTVKRESMRLAGEGWALQCTTDHPLFDPVAAAWAPAGDWVLGKRSALLFVGDEGAPPQVVDVQERTAVAGICELVDLSVSHALHNFVAEGVLVHNKPPIQPNCALPDGGTALQLSACTCLDGSSGSLDCSFDGTGTQCVSCATRDAGP